MTKTKTSILAFIVTSTAWALPAAAQTPAQPASSEKAKSAPTKTEKSAASKPEDALKKLTRKYDEMRGIAWYQHPSSPKFRNSNGVYLYFGKKDDGSVTPLRLVTQYYADSWLFVRRAWAKADGVNIDLPSGSGRYGNWERDNGSGSIWEWADSALISTSEKTAIRNLAFAKKVTVRYEGDKYYDDKSLSQNQLKAMQADINTYEAVTGTPWK